MSPARRLSPQGPRRSTDVWGWCGVCERWFYPRHGGVEPACPVCATPAEKTAEQPDQAES